MSCFEEIKSSVWRRRKIIRILHQTESDSCHTAHALLRTRLQNLNTKVFVVFKYH